MRRLVMSLLTTLLFLAVPLITSAAEVKNVKVSQVDDKAVATYDLVGGAGEQEAEVTVTISVNGEKKTSDNLHITGDFGKNVKVGYGKKIVWNATKDLPADFDGELSWDIQASKPQVSLEVTLKFIQEKMMQHPENNYVTFVHSTANNSDWTETFKAKISEISFNIQNCLLSFHWHAERNGETTSDVPNAGIPFRQVVKAEIMTMAQSTSKANAETGRPEVVCTQTNPELFVLRVIRQDGTYNVLNFEDEDTANRVAKAIMHAAELCGGGEKSPF